MHLFKGLTILVLFLFVGEVLSAGLSLVIPGNIVGMILFLLALLAGVVPVKVVEEACDFLLSHLALLFVPAGVGIMAYFDLIREAFWPLIIGTVLSTILVLVVTGKTATILSSRKEKEKKYERNL